MRKIILLSWILFISVFLSACHIGKEKKAAEVKTATAVLQSVPTQLYYSGIMSPISVVNVISPTDGVIDQVLFKYGDKVKEGQPLLIIVAPKLQQDYQSAFTDYLKAKEDYLNSITNFQGTQELKKAGIISNQEYLSERNQYDNTVLAYINAKNSLESKIKKLSGVPVDIEKLSLEDIQTISEILHSQYDKIKILANDNGAVLIPTKMGDDDSGSSTGKNLVVGNEVKEGQILVTIGNLSGIATTIQASELVINKIKPGLPVTVTSEGLPNIVLHGMVKTVGVQAQVSTDSNSGLSTFPVTVVIPKLTPEQTQLIRVGMTTKVQITLENPPLVILPIEAVSHRNGIDTVTLVDPKTGKMHDVPVITGLTTLTDIAIMQGVKPGDKVVVP